MLQLMVYVELEIHVTSSLLKSSLNLVTPQSYNAYFISEKHRHGCTVTHLQ